MLKHFLPLALFLTLISCGEDKSDPDLSVETEVNTAEETVSDKHIISEEDSDVYLQILGTVQDGGSPHAGCKKDCCAELFDHPDPSRMVVSLGVVDRINEQTWLFEATPDLGRQMKILQRSAKSKSETPDGIFITHAHIGHYAGLMFLGREACSSTEVPVFAMPRLRKFLEENGPWSQLVELKNIVLHSMENETTTMASDMLSVTPIIVPHRDEYSETVGFRIQGPNKSALFIPDIDKWSHWDHDILEEIKKVDYAFLDATFYGQNELQHRDMSEVPHPFVVESMDLFETLSETDKNKVYFIHLNHSNPLLNTDQAEIEEVTKRGFHVAEFGATFPL